MNDSHIDPQTGATYGDVVPGRTQYTSKIEATVRDFLVEAGLPVQERLGVLCHHPEPGKRFLTITPDVVWPEHRLAVEVDPCNQTDRQRTHHGAEARAKDRLRNDLLAAVGWTVIRLRLAAEPDDYIGDRDVVAASKTLTESAGDALLAAIDDFVNEAEAVVRHVAKSASPRPAKRRSHVVNFGEDRYTHDGFLFSWFPDLESSKKVTLRLCHGGRYLYTHEHRVPRFIARVDLHEVSREEWKERLTEVLMGRDPADIGTTKWPWGDTLLQAIDDAPEANEFVTAADLHEKRTIDTVDFRWAYDGHHVTGWEPEGLLWRDPECLFVEIHPEARAVGYRFEYAESHTARRGDYQRFGITRFAE